MRQTQALWTVLKETVNRWLEDKVPRLGAALAYYTIFSIVPLLVIIIAMVGLFFGQDVAQSYILDQMATLVGQQSTDTIRDMLQRAHRPSSGLLATAVAGGTLLLGASGLFGQLQDALNSIWRVESKEGRGFWGLLQDRFLSFMAVLGTGFLLLVSLVLSAGLAVFGKWFGALLPAPELVLQAINLVVSFAVITLLFAMMFKVLPDAQIAWQDVWTGAAMTAFLFTIGKFLIGLYLGKSDVGSAYGAAGSLVILLVWVYYSAQILLFGAEFTQVYAHAHGTTIVPTPHAEKTAPSEGNQERSAAMNITEGHAMQRPRKNPRDGENRLAGTPQNLETGPLSTVERWITAGMVFWTVLNALREVARDQKRR